MIREFSRLSLLDENTDKAALWSVVFGLPFGEVYDIFTSSRGVGSAVLRALVKPNEPIYIGRAVDNLVEAHLKPLVHDEQ